MPLRQERAEVQAPLAAGDHRCPHRGQVLEALRHAGCPLSRKLVHRVAGHNCWVVREDAHRLHHVSVAATRYQVRDSRDGVASRVRDAFDAKPVRTGFGRLRLPRGRAFAPDQVENAERQQHGRRERHDVADRVAGRVRLQVEDVPDRVGQAEGEEGNQRDHDPSALEPDGRGQEHHRRGEEEAAEVGEEVLVVGGQRRDPAEPEREVLVEGAREEQRIKAQGTLDDTELDEREPRFEPVAGERAVVHFLFLSFCSTRASATST